MQNRINKETKIKILPEYLSSPEFIDEVYSSCVFYQDSDNVYPATFKYVGDNWFTIMMNIVLTHNIVFGTVERIDFPMVFTKMISQIKLIVLYPSETKSPTPLLDLIFELENIHLPKNFFLDEEIEKFRNKYYVSKCRLDGLLALYIIEKTEHL